AIRPGPAGVVKAAARFNRRLEKDESTGSIPHVFSSSFVWEIPVGVGRRWSLRGWRNAVAGGWELAGMLRLQSGSPLAVVQQTNLNAFPRFRIPPPHPVPNPHPPSAHLRTS